MKAKSKFVVRNIETKKAENDMFWLKKGTYHFREKQSLLWPISTKGLQEMYNYVSKSRWDVQDLEKSAGKLVLFERWNWMIKFFVRVAPNQRHVICMLEKLRKSF